MGGLHTYIGSLWSVLAALASSFSSSSSSLFLTRSLCRHSPMCSFVRRHFFQQSLNDRSSFFAIKPTSPRYSQPQKMSSSPKIPFNSRKWTFFDNCKIFRLLRLKYCSSNEFTFFSQVFCENSISSPRKTTNAREFIDQTSENLLPYTWGWEC